MKFDTEQTIYLPNREIFVSNAASRWSDGLVVNSESGIKNDHRSRSQRSPADPASHVRKLPFADNAPVLILISLFVRCSGSMDKRRRTRSPLTSHLSPLTSHPRPSSPHLTRTLYEILVARQLF